MFLARFEYVRREHGPGMVEAELPALDPSDRGALRGVDGREWYPFGTLVRLDGAIARITAPGDDARLPVLDFLGALTDTPSGGPLMLEPGAPAPDFEVKDQTGQTRRLSDFRGKNVVLWFYPKADTPG